MVDLTFRCIKISKRYLAFLSKIKGYKSQIFTEQGKKDCLQNQVIYSYAAYLYIQTPLTNFPHTQGGAKGGL